MNTPLKKSERRYPPVKALEEWLAKAPLELRKLLAEFADTEMCMYRQWVSGRRALSAEKAGALEQASKDIAVMYPMDAPKPMSRGELCESCNKCPHYQQSLKQSEK